MSYVMAKFAPEPISWSTHRQRKSRRQLYYDVVIFDERGAYPRGTYALTDSVFHADDEIAFSVVRGRSWSDLDPELPYTEVSALLPGHMRLIASFLLCEERGGRRFVFYPATPRGLRLNAQRLRLASPDVISQIRELVLARCESERTSRQPRLFRPPGPSFNVLDPEDFAVRRLREFFYALNPVNYIVYRGLYALMKADMLACHEEFWEEATIACYVALDASFAAVREVLEAGGKVNPSARDVAMWVHEHFNDPFGLPEPGPDDRYFGEMYEQRIMTLHPSSRYGEMPVAPLMMEDYMFMRRDIREFFAFLVSGRHGEDFMFDLDLHRGRCGPSARRKSKRT